jgi:hypothetical protein
MANWGNAQYTELLKFRQRLDKLARVELDEFCRKASRELAARLLALAIKETLTGHKPTIPSSAAKIRPLKSRAQAAKAGHS